MAPTTEATDAMATPLAPRPFDGAGVFRLELADENEVCAVMMQEMTSYQT